MYYWYSINNSINNINIINSHIFSFIYNKFNLYMTYNLYIIQKLCFKKLKLIRNIIYRKIYRKLLNI